VLQLSHRSKEEEYLATDNTRRGWDLFNQELAWLIFDFFKYKLSPYDKLLFYGYYIMGFTLEELGERAHISFQGVHMRINKINKGLKKFYYTRHNGDKA